MVTVDLGRVVTAGGLADGVAISAAGQVSAAIGSIETLGGQSMGFRATAGGAIEAAMGSVATSGNRAVGLWLVSDSVDLRAGQVATAGEQAIGIRASTQGDFSIAVGELETQGVQAHGVQAAVGGDAALSVGTIAAWGTGSDGINLVAQGAVDIEVAQGGGIRVAHDAVALSTGNGATLVNRGTIFAGGVAIRVGNGESIIWNGGNIDGAMFLADAADRVTNTATMRPTPSHLGSGDDRLTNDGELTLAGDLDFGEGADMLINRGILSLEEQAAAGGRLRDLATGPVARSIAGLSNFANSGVIDLRSGVAGDVLSISGSFEGSGDSTVALDVRFNAADVADRLIIADAATGTTRIVINPLDGPMSLNPGVVLVSAGAGTQADAFRLDSLGRLGFLAPGLAFDSGTNSFRLVTAPSAGAYRLLKVGEGARSAWLDSSDTIAAHLAGQGRGFWLAAGGNVNRRSQMRRFDGFGFAQDIDLGYAQDAFSSQFGYGIERGRFTMGVTAGYGNSALKFDGSADRVKYDAWNGGVYARLRSGRFRASAIVKYDHYGIRVSLPSIDENAATKGSALGARVEAGARLGSPRFYAEPRISLSYQRVAIDPLALSAVALFGDWDGGRGTAGLRVASVRPMGCATLNVYAETDYVKALGERPELVFATDAVMLEARDGRFPDHGAGKVGFEVSSGRTFGFVEAVARYGGSYRGGGARAGLRIGF